MDMQTAIFFAKQFDTKDARIRELEEENERLRSALKNMVFAYQNKDDDFPHQFERDATLEAKRALGGK